ncbi:transcriptional regulator family: Centromere protein B DNA-binding region [Penicillium manginii]|uniref:transcriptional regulator family: Centromere protein B DNA-binding region n=1 Tax=Penicillium manginii TaxID=203109 RepID=UPI00254712DA|nr:transcriptional regulator family: Centromere protein B DNA-binding region [Penicillium manginii]KAJ5742297.1 transcriptional regulator family: Centromere protein B DNA-binding region [Penicillium manginii]
MPKFDEIRESRVIKACAAARAVKKPNIKRIAREFDVPYGVLHGRIKYGRTSLCGRNPTNMALTKAQDRALQDWVDYMQRHYMPLTPAMVEAYANRLITCAKKPRSPVSHMWAYRFIERLPPHKKLAPVRQKVKDVKRIGAEEAGVLELWYNNLARVTKTLPPHLVFNFDECGFQPGKGKPQNVISGTEYRSDLPEAEHSENITALECIAADGSSIPPLYIFKGSTFQEDWFYASEQLPEGTITSVSKNGWINDDLALEWLNHFQKHTIDRVRPGEKRLLLFDGHGSHKTEEFITRCLNWDIIPFCFLAHSTHICQPLDGKPFLALKQHFKKENNELSFWGREPAGKSEFLRVITNVRRDAWGSRRILRDGFKERGIYPTDGTAIVKALEKEMPIFDDLVIPDYAIHGEKTPPPEFPSSSSVEATPPKSMEKRLKNYAKCANIPGIQPKHQRNIDRIFQYAEIDAERATIASDTVAKMAAIRTPLQRRKSKRQIKPLSQNGILSIKDANRSIATSALKRERTAKTKLRNAYKKQYGRSPPPSPKPLILPSNDAELANLPDSALFSIDTTPLR